MIQKTIANYPFLLTREQASQFLGIDPKSFDRYVRPHDQLERFMVGRHERYTINSLIEFIKANSV